MEKLRQIMKRKGKLVPYPLLFPILIPLIFPFLFLGMVICFVEPYLHPPVHHVEVHGQDCHLEYVIERFNSHGGPIGHDKVVCP
jgi:hypothetical protein